MTETLAATAPDVSARQESAQINVRNRVAIESRFNLHALLQALLTMEHATFLNVAATIIVDWGVAANWQGCKGHEIECASNFCGAWSIESCVGRIDAIDPTHY